MQLISKAQKIFSGIDFKKIQRAGIERNDVNTFSHSQSIVTYPPLAALEEITPREAYPEGCDKSLKEIELYLHLPFCTGKCTYCGYVTLSKTPQKLIERYLTAIEKEIDLFKRNTDIQEVNVNSIYIGGGTPTYLSTQQWDKLFTVLRTEFKLKEGAEVTVEAAPETILDNGWERIYILAENGVNRLSIGFQTLDDRILKLVGRRHDSRQAQDAFNLAKDAGFKNINIDLIPGLPDHTLEIWHSDLERVKGLEPTSVTCYPLSIKRNAAIWSMYQRERKRFPSKENAMVMQVMANEFFSELGYTQLPVGWFVKHPEIKQPSYKFNKCENQLALGVSTYSFVNGFQYFNYKDISKYFEAVEGNNLPIWRGTKLSEEDLMRREIIFGLKAGLSKKVFQVKFGMKPKDVFQDTWAKLEDLDLIEEDRGKINLSYTGKLLADEVCKEFYANEILRC